MSRTTIHFHHRPLHVTPGQFGPHQAVLFAPEACPVGSESLRAGRPPNVTDENAFLEWIRSQVGDQTRLLPFTAGNWYELSLPSLEVSWRWKWDDRVDWELHRDWPQRAAAVMDEARL